MDQFLTFDISVISLTNTIVNAQLLGILFNNVNNVKGTVVGIYFQF